MWKNLVLSFLILGSHGILLSHVVEIHLPNAGEDYEIELGKKELRNQENLETFNSSSSSQEEKEKALNQLIKDEGMS